MCDKCPNSEKYIYLGSYHSVCIHVYNLSSFSWINYREKKRSNLLVKIANVVEIKFEYAVFVIDEFLKN